MYKSLFISYSDSVNRNKVFLFVDKIDIIIVFELYRDNIIGFRKIKILYCISNYIKFKNFMI